jgi:hypothetical protein
LNLPGFSATMSNVWKKTKSFHKRETYVCTIVNSLQNLKITSWNSLHESQYKSEEPCEFCKLYIRPSYHLRQFCQRMS